MSSAVTSKGQVTIPKVTREQLGLKPGDRVKFFLRPDGRGAVMLPVLPVTALRGSLKSKRQRPVSLAEMDEAIARGAAGLRQRKKRK